MVADEAQQFVDRASICVSRGESADALVWLDRARKHGGEDGREQLLRGLALAHAGRTDEALESLRRSTMLSPDEPRTFYNYACILAHSGDLALAKEVVGEALRLRPYYPAAMRLREGLETGRVHAMYDLGEAHTIPLVADAGKSWTVLGWSIASFALVMAIARWIHPVAFMAAKAGNQPLTLGTSPLDIGIVFLSIVSVLCSFLWVCVDLYDRRGRIIWLVPMLVFSFWQGWVAIPHALYMLIARKLT